MKNWKGRIDKPEVSVCCITYNHENFISEALDGFLMQETNFPFEVIVRDDASPDRTADIIREYEKKYPNIIKPIYELENGYQKGIKPSSVTFKKAVGKYIALCEGDDYWTDEKKLQIQKDFLDKNEEYVICYTDVEAFDNSGVLRSYIGGVKRDLTQDELKIATPINTLTVMFRNVIEEFPHEMTSSKYGDLFLWSILGYKGSGKYLPNIKPARYRFHDGGVHSSQSHNEKYENTLITYVLLLAYHKRLNRKDLVNYYKKRIIYSIIQTNGFGFVSGRLLKEAILEIYLKCKLIIKKMLKSKDNSNAK